MNMISIFNRFMSSEAKLALGLAILTSCASASYPAAKEPWSEFGEGATVIGASTGWSFYQGKVKAAGKSGVLTGDSGSDTTTLTPNYGVALKMHHMLTDKFALGAIVEYRSFSPDSLKPLSATLTAEDFETLHLILSSRYFFDAFDTASRWRPLIGLDLSYVPEVDLGDVDVAYPASTSLPNERVSIVGSEYWGLGGLAGLQYLISENTLFDIGLFYEYALSTSDATVSFQSLGGAQADMALRAQGLIFYFGLSYSF
ncbi:MAG: outer membrane protein W [Planctomycetota bacterium]|jgi:outer membrane protein W